MLDTLKIMELLENQERRNQAQQETIREQNKIIREYEKRHQLYEELIRSVVEESNLLREHLGLEKRECSDFLGS